MKKKILQKYMLVGALSAGLILSLTACGGSAADSSDDKSANQETTLSDSEAESQTGATEEESQTDAAEAEDSGENADDETSDEVESAFYSYIAEWNVLYGYQGTVSVKMIEYTEEDGSTYEYPTPMLGEFIDSYVGFTMFDLDQDGQDELLSAYLNEDGTLTFEVAEYENGQVQQVASWSGEDEDDRPELMLSMAGQDTKSEMSEAYIYTMDGQVLIGIEQHALSSLFADGYSSIFRSLKYEDGQLVYLDGEYFAGSDADESVIANVENNLQQMGITVDGEKWIWGDAYVRDAVDWSVRLYGIDVDYVCSYDDAYDWYNAGTDEELYVADLYCYSVYDLQDVTISSPEE